MRKTKKGLITQREAAAEIGQSERHVRRLLVKLKEEGDRAVVHRHMRRLLNQVANAGARAKGSIFEIVYRRMVPPLGHNQTIGAISHRQCRLIWLILHEGVRYEERGSGLSKRSKQLRNWKMIRELRNLGYQIEPPHSEPKQTSVQ